MKNKSPKLPKRLAAHKINPLISSDDLSSAEQTIAACNTALTCIREAILAKRGKDWVVDESQGYSYLIEAVQGALEYEQQDLEAKRGGEVNE